MKRIISTAMALYFTFAPGFIARHFSKNDIDTAHAAESIDNIISNSQASEAILTQLGEMEQTGAVSYFEPRSTEEPSPSVNIDGTDYMFDAVYYTNQGRMVLLKYGSNQTDTQDFVTAASGSGLKYFIIPPSDSTDAVKGSVASTIAETPQPNLSLESSYDTAQVTWEPGSMELLLLQTGKPPQVLDYNNGRADFTGLNLGNFALYGRIPGGAWSDPVYGNSTLDFNGNGRVDLPDALGFMQTAAGLRQHNAGLPQAVRTLRITSGHRH